MNEDHTLGMIVAIYGLTFTVAIIVTMIANMRMK